MCASVQGRDGETQRAAEEKREDRKEKERGDNGNVGQILQLRRPFG